MVLESLAAAVDAFFVLAAALVGVAGLYGCGSQLWSAAVLLRGGTTTVGDLTPETTTTVVGQPRTDDPLTAPLSGDPCVAVHITEWTAFFGEGGVSDAALSVSGLEWWEDDAASERHVAAAVPFRLRDAEEVAVDPARDDADPVPGFGREDAVPLAPLEAFDLRDAPETVRAVSGEDPGLDAFPDDLASFVAANPDLRGDSDRIRRWRYLERCVSPSGEVSVTASVVSADGERVLSHEGTFVLSDTGVGETARHRVGVAAVLFGIAVICLWFAVSTAATSLDLQVPLLPPW
ncbi:hypothetical protein ACFR9U_19005 [Halorientalis brevis]|uniref:RING-type E3 ubiquitin transferase n=1 Tax=Halorientalis brevis TaxID=1126241 RepID=A0ABD6CHK0_9EURY|nr:hypothetical protein [Halorientalis brevis]